MPYKINMVHWNQLPFNNDDNGELTPSYFDFQYQHNLRNTTKLMFHQVLWLGTIAFQEPYSYQAVAKKDLHH